MNVFVLASSGFCLRANLLPFDMGVLLMYVRRGFGDATNTTLAGVAATGAAQTGALLGTLGKMLGGSNSSSGGSSDGSFLTSLGQYAGPVGAAVAALTGIAIALVNVFKGCGQTCIAATNIANQCDALMTQNVNAYTSSPVRYASMQAAALNTFDTAWAALVQNCNNPALQAAGQRCITDRQRGACTWKASPGGWNPDGTFTQWGKAGSGSACWNWFIGMRDPIANDPFVQPDPTPSSVGSQVGSVGQSVAASVSSIPTPLLIAAGLGIAAFAFGGRD